MLDGIKECHSQYHSRKIVEIQVQFEDEKKTFPVPIELLNFGAPNFAKLFPHPNVRAIKIEDVSVKTFDIFLGWLITGYLCEPTHDSDAIREWVCTADVRFTSANRARSSDTVMTVSSG
jgi:hypothetical protein